MRETANLSDFVCGCSSCSHSSFLSYAERDVGDVPISLAISLFAQQLDKAEINQSDLLTQ